MTDLSENGWAGTNASALLASLWVQTNKSASAMARSVIVIDEFDKLSTRGATGTSLDFQRGRQQTPISFVGGNPIRFSAPGAREHSFMWDSRQALTIAAGVFRGLPRHRPPLPRDLVRFGFMPELIERIGSLLRLDPLAPALLSRVLRAGLRDEVAAYAALGYELRITDEACGRVARAVVAGSLHAGSRQAVSLLASAAHA